MSKAGASDTSSRVGLEPISSRRELDDMDFVRLLDHHPEQYNQNLYALCIISSPEHRGTELYKLFLNRENVFTKFGAKTRWMKLRELYTEIRYLVLRHMSLPRWGEFRSKTPREARISEMRRILPDNYQFFNFIELIVDRVMEK